MDFQLQSFETFRLLEEYLPNELVLYIFDLWLGPLDDCMYGLALRVTKHQFNEGVEWFTTHYASNVLLLNQMLYGAALIPDIPLSIHLLDVGATDLESAINLALEHGYLPYIRAILYLKNSPYTPLSVHRWIRYLEKNR